MALCSIGELNMKPIINSITHIILTPMFTLLVSGTLISGVLSFIVNRNNTIRKLSQIYAGESDWTKRLIKVVETPLKEVNEEKLLIVKRSLRIYKKSDVPALNIENIWFSGILEKIKKKIQKKFKKAHERKLIFGETWDFFCDISSSYLDEILNKPRNTEGEVVLTKSEVINIQLIAQTLLTNRWEYTVRQLQKNLPLTARNKLIPIFIMSTVKIIYDNKKILDDYSKKEEKNRLSDTFKLFLDEFKNSQDDDVIYGIYKKIIEEQEKKMKINKELYKYGYWILFLAVGILGFFGGIAVGLHSH